MIAAPGRVHRTVTTDRETSKVPAGAPWLHEITHDHAHDPSNNPIRLGGPEFIGLRPCTNALINDSDPGGEILRLRRCKVVIINSAFRRALEDPSGAAFKAAPANMNMDCEMRRKLLRVDGSRIKRLTLLWQIYSRRCSLQIHF
jgi:hypothetical protein